MIYDKETWWRLYKAHVTDDAVSDTSDHETTMVTYGRRFFSRFGYGRFDRRAAQVDPHLRDGDSMALVGGAFGYLAEALLRSRSDLARIVIIDPSQYVADHLAVDGAMHEKITWEHISVLDATGSYDVVISEDVLSTEHDDDVAKAIATKCRRLAQRDVIHFVHCNVGHWSQHDPSVWIVSRNQPHPPYMIALRNLDDYARFDPEAHLFEMVVG